MSNSTQNKVFNDLPEKDQKEIIQGAMEHAKKLQDEVLDTQQDTVQDTPQDTQNDWAKDLNYIDFVTPEDMDRCVALIRKLLASARKEVIEKVEKGFNRYRSDKYKTDSLALSYKRWVMLKNSIIKDDHI